MWPWLDRTTGSASPGRRPDNIELDQKATELAGLTFQLFQLGAFGFEELQLLFAAAHGFPHGVVLRGHP
jgi:hypothetical protein